MNWQGHGDIRLFIVFAFSVIYIAKKSMFQSVVSKCGNDRRAIEIFSNDIQHIATHVFECTQQAVVDSLQVNSLHDDCQNFGWWGQIAYLKSFFFIDETYIERVYFYYFPFYSSPLFYSPPLFLSSSIQFKF